MKMATELDKREEVKGCHRDSAGDHILPIVGTFKNTNSMSLTYSLRLQLQDQNLSADGAQ
jgi:hypothetical protein